MHFFRVLTSVLAAVSFVGLTAPLVSSAATSAPLASAPAPEQIIKLKRIQIDDVSVFYREAGDPTAPTVILLHGFPTSSLMYRNLIPILADRYHVVAPDLPGFGFTRSPDRAQYAYTFDHLAFTMDHFLEALKIHRYALQVFDYGAPIGYRLAMAHPERVTAIISQNGNAYEEGLSQVWNPIEQYWKAPTAVNRDALRPFLSLDTIKWQYTKGVPDPEQVEPAMYTLDATLVSNPENMEIQLDLFGDYASNVVLYRKFQAYFRQYHPPILAVWGRNDPFFLPAGAEAFKRDAPKAEVHLYDTGHFALETHVSEIGAAIHSFLDRNVAR